MSKARRGRGEGSVYERKDGRWVSVLSSGISKDGKRVRHLAYSDSKTAALKKLDLLKRKYGTRGQIDPTLRDFLNDWLHGIEHTLAGATYDLYEGLIDAICADLGDIRVTQLRSEHVKKWANASRTVTRQKALRLLKQALNQAEATDLILKNPAQHIKPPKTVKTERVPLTPQQVNAYLATAGEHRLSALVIMAIFTTMREGELLGLQWQDIDWEAKVVHVRHALTRQRGGSYALGSPKTAKSRRAIALPDFVVDALQLHRKRMMAENHGSTYVFCGPTGAVIHPSNLRNRFHYPTLKAATLPRITFHDLRHTAATLLAHLGVHPRVAQDRLGHSSVRLTLELYTHSDLELQREAAKKLHERFGKP